MWPSTINQTLVAERSWDGKLPQELDVELGPGVLREGDNLLEVENVGDTGAAYSMVYVDRYAVTYRRLARAEGGRLEGRWTESGTAEISGCLLELGSSIRLEPSRCGSPVLPPRGITSFVSAPRRSTTISSSMPPRCVIPRSAKPPRAWLKRNSNQAEYIVLGPRAFLDAARPLVDHRRRQGLTVRAVPIEQIYAEFGFGESRPEAIREFLSYAYHHWKAPSLRYVLLLGDATYDFKNYYGTNVENHVPPLMLETRFSKTASDPTYAAVNGDDLLPDVAIGRLPAASVDEVRGHGGKDSRLRNGRRFAGGAHRPGQRQPGWGGRF